jgi:hypothetical protein
MSFERKHHNDNPEHEAGRAEVIDELTTAISQAAILRGNVANLVNLQSTADAVMAPVIAMEKLRMEALSLASSKTPKSEIDRILSELTEAMNNVRSVVTKTQSEDTPAA